MKIRRDLPMAILALFFLLPATCARDDLWSYFRDIGREIIITDVIADHSGRSITLRWTEPTLCSGIRISYTGPSSEDLYIEASHTRQGEYTLSSAETGAVYRFTIRACFGPKQSRGAVHNAACGIYFVSVTGSAEKGGGWFDHAVYSDPSSAAAEAAADGIALIWTQGGRYHPSTAIALTDGMEIRGGFAGSEISLSDRPLRDRDGNGTTEAWEFASESVIDGDREGNDTFNAEPDGSGSAATADNGFRIPAGVNLDCVIRIPGTASGSILDGLTITGGSASGHGGGIKIDLPGSSPAINRCVIRQNRAAGGGGIHIPQGNCSISDSLFTLNYASASDGGGAVLTENSSGDSFSRCRFSRNISSDTGGALRSVAAADLSLGQCIFDNNSASHSGGGVYLGAGSSISFTDCSFMGNLCDDSAAYSSQGGGALYSYDATGVSFTGCNFSDNDSANFGGALCCQSPGGHYFQNCTFTGNSAAIRAGALYTDSSESIDGLRMEYCDFTGNSAEQGGALFSNNAGFEYYSNSVFSGNRATGISPAGQGGAVYTLDGKASFVNCRYSANSADTSGGAFCRALNSGSGSVLLLNCLLESNRSAAGGSAVTVNNGQTASAAPAPSTAIVNCLLYNNVVTGFSGNSGTVYTDDAEAGRAHNFLFLNSLLYGNDTINPTMTAGLSFNSMASSTTSHIYSSIFWKNMLAGSTGSTHFNFYEYNGSTVHYVRNSLVYSTALSDLALFRFAGYNTTSGDPAFADEDSSDFRISAGSPAEDAGEREVFRESGFYPFDIDLNGDGLMGADYPDFTDMEGEARVAGGQADIGPCEVN
jgi:hypothetical protein